MSRSSAPSYRLHRQSGKAIVTLPSADGRRRDVLLGKFGTVQSRINYERVIAEWEANGRNYHEKIGAVDTTVGELLTRFMRHAALHYRRRDGTPTSEVFDYVLTLRPVRLFYSKHADGMPRLARDFGPLALKAIRQKMIDGYQHPKYGQQSPLSRKVINQRIGRIRRVFKWGVENELVPASVLTALAAVKGLQAGRSKAIEKEPIRPVSLAIVKKTIPHLNRQLAGMVRLQLRMAARPGEVCVMRGCDIDVSGDVWIYRPPAHKMAHLEREKEIAIGPRGQKVIRQFIKREPEDYLFSPTDARFEWTVAVRAKRQTPVQPSQQNRKKANPKKQPGRHYLVRSYAQAIAKACKKAGVPHWHPHQLRHTAGTIIRRKYGIDVARAILGHRSPKITEIYAEIDRSHSVSVMKKIG